MSTNAPGQHPNDEAVHLRQERDSCLRQMVDLAGRLQIATQRAEAAEQSLRDHIKVTTAALKRAEAAEGKLAAADSHMRTEMCRAMQAEKRVKELEAELAASVEGSAAAHFVRSAQLRARIVELEAALKESQRVTSAVASEPAGALAGQLAQAWAQRDEAQRVARVLASGQPFGGHASEPDRDWIAAQQIAVAYPKQKPEPHESAPIDPKEQP